MNWRRSSGLRRPSLSPPRLLFGDDRLQCFPDAWIQAGCVATSVGRCPPVAVREALVNAVAHTDYAQPGAPIRVALFDDRLEVENPGLLPFGLTVADLPMGVSKLRNRVIGRVLHELGLSEQWGSGIQRMVSACRDAGLATPVFEEIGVRFRVTLFTTGACPRRKKSFGLMTSDTCQLAPISPFLLGSAGLCGYGGGTSDSYEIASFLGLKLAFRGLNGLSLHSPGAFWALLPIPRGHLRSNTLAGDDRPFPLSPYAFRVFA